jgi:hypothetical protein
MNAPLNPYQPTTSELTPRVSAYSTGDCEWDGRKISVAAEQMARSLWLAARCRITIDGHETFRFAKWRWNKTYEGSFSHRGRMVAATLEFSGAKTLLCRLLIDGVLVGEMMVPSQGFWKGLTVTSSVVLATLWLLRHSLGRLGIS